jgi:hypothetical protein
MLIPGGCYQIACPRCHATIDFETWPDTYTPPPATVTRLHGGATPVEDTGLTTPRPREALSKG